MNSRQFKESTENDIQILLKSLSIRNAKFYSNFREMNFIENIAEFSSYKCLTSF